MSGEFNTSLTEPSSQSKSGTLGQALGCCGFRLAERSPGLVLLNGFVKAPDGEYRKADQRQRHSEAHAVTALGSEPIAQPGAEHHREDAHAVHAGVIGAAMRLAAPIHHYGKKGYGRHAGDKVIDHDHR